MLVFSPYFSENDSQNSCMLVLVTSLYNLSFNCFHVSEYFIYAARKYPYMILYTFSMKIVGAKQ